MTALAPPESLSKSNLAIALRCLPATRRPAALVFYRFCRAVDDIADDPGLPTADKYARLAAWSEALASGRGLPEELARVIDLCKLDRQLLAEIVAGCTMDVEPPRYATLADLEAYCWKVACAVGLVSIQIFGCKGKEAPAYAEDLGHALQLTNILRDVGEDASLGRVYLPDDLLLQHHVQRDHLLARHHTPEMHALFAHVARLARNHFLAAEARLPIEDRRALLPARIMASIYRRLLHRIERSGYDVLRRRFSLSKARKAAIFAAVGLRSAAGL